MTTTLKHVSSSEVYEITINGDVAGQGHVYNNRDSGEWYFKIAFEDDAIGSHRRTDHKKYHSAADAVSAMELFAVRTYPEVVAAANKLDGYVISQ